MSEIQQYKNFQYPHLHIITWGLPKRYFGLLRIFNLQIEYQPRLFLNDCLESLAEYESHTSSTLPPIKSALINPAPNNSKYDYTIKDEKVEPEPQLAQNTDKGGNSSGRHRRRLCRKPIISIKINLDDDLRNVKSRNYGKNLDQILSKSSRKTHLLVIEKSSSSKRDEYHLRIVNNNTIHSHPYSKLLRKNRRKYELPLSVPDFEGTTSKSIKVDHERVPASNFIFESIYPPLNKSQIEFMTKMDSSKQYFTKTAINSTCVKTNNEVNCFSGGIANQVVSLHSDTVFNNDIIRGIVRNEALEPMNCGISNPNIISPSVALSVPSELIPYEEPISEEKPLRNWPIITQIFNSSNFEICKNYIKSLVADEKEDKEVEQETATTDVEDVAIDISLGIKYHNSSKLTTLLVDNASSQNEKRVDEEVNVSLDLETSNTKVAILDKNDEMDSKWSDKLEEQLKPPNYVVNQVSVLSSGTCSGQTSQSNLFASTATLQIDYADDQLLEKETTAKTFHNEAWQISHSRYSVTDSLVNMRLLSSSTKTYESIVTPNSQEDYGVDDVIKEGTPDKNNTEKDNIVETCKDGTKVVRKFYIIGIAIAILISIILGMILFITISDSSETSGIIAEYFK